MEILTPLSGDITLENNLVLQIPLQVYYLKDLLLGPQGSCKRIFIDRSNSVHRIIGTV